MRKLALIIALLFGFSWQVEAATTICGGRPAAGGGAAAPSCSEASNEIGIRTDGVANDLIGTGYIACFAYTADCSGKMTTGWLRQGGPVIDNAKVCAYSTAGSSANPGTNGSSNAKMSCSAAISSSAAGWFGAAMDTAADTTATTIYWVCFIPDTTDWRYNYATGQGLWYKTCSGCYAAPPSDLSGEWTEAANHKGSIYITVGP